MDIQEDQITPIIIIKRKKKVQEEGHHGGAWKVAYADFVTAMMAFFLLMWLLNATTEDQRKGLADYFNPTIPISRISGGGSDGLNGSSIFTEQTFAQMGTGATRKKTTRSPSEETITASLEALKQSLDEADGQLSEHLFVKLSPEGIILELVDSDDAPLFALGDSTPAPLLGELLIAVTDTFTEFENDIKIVGHTDDTLFRNSVVSDNWTLSADRANAARRLLTSMGTDPARIREVSGKADTEPLVEGDPSAARNRRISIVILTKKVVAEG